MIGTSTCIAREGSFFVRADRVNDEFDKLATRDCGSGQCLEQDYSAICRPREQESCFVEARIFLLSAKAKHGWWLVVLVVSISPVPARPFSPLEGSPHVESVERKGKPRKQKDSKVKRGVDSCIAVSGAQEASGRVSGTCVEK